MRGAAWVTRTSTPPPVRIVQPAQKAIQRIWPSVYCAGPPLYHGLPSSPYMRTPLWRTRRSCKFTAPPVGLFP